MTDLLSIATFAADQIPLSFDRVAGIDVTYVIGIYGPMVEIQIDYNQGPEFYGEAPEPWCPHGTDTSCTCLDEEESTVSATQTIIAEMRAANVDAITTFNQDVDERVATQGRRMRRNGRIHNGGPSYRNANREALSEANATWLPKAKLADVRNDQMREASLPRMAYKMAKTGGRQTPDMLESLLAFFKAPHALAAATAIYRLPAKVSAKEANALLSDPFVVDVIEGLGVEVPTNIASLIRSINPGSGRAGGRPRKVRSYFLTDGRTFPLGHTHTYVSGAVPMGRIPGGNDVAQGPNAQRRIDAS